MPSLPEYDRLDATELAALVRRKEVSPSELVEAAIERIEGIVYFNDGDWVESCTAVVEDACGHLEILRWSVFGERHGAVPDANPTGELVTASA